MLTVDGNPITEAMTGVPTAAGTSKRRERGYMSIARMNVWVTRVGDPCKIDMEHQWFVHVLHCDGKILDWCNRRYTNIRTQCGHVEFSVPPGQYMVCATMSPAQATESPTSLGNHISHLALARVNCGDHACVTLFPPTFHWCGVWWIRALEVHVEMGAVDRDQAGAAMDAVRGLLGQVPVDPFTEAMDEIEAQDAKAYEFDPDME